MVAGQTSRKTNQDRAGLSRAVHRLRLHHASWRPRSRSGSPPGGPCGHCVRWRPWPTRSAARWNLGARLPAVTAQDVVGRLTTSFNAMMDRLRAGLRPGRVGPRRPATVHRRRLARAAHAADDHPATTPSSCCSTRPPRNPTGPRPCGTSLARSVRMSRLIENLLTLARADGGVRSAPGPGRPSRHARRGGLPAGGHPAPRPREIGFAGTPARAVQPRRGHAAAAALDPARQRGQVHPSPPAGSGWRHPARRHRVACSPSPTTATGLPSSGSRSGSSTGSTGRIASRSGAGAGLGPGDRGVDRAASTAGAVVAANNDRGRSDSLLGGAARRAGRETGRRSPSPPAKPPRARHPREPRVGQALAHRSADLGRAGR